MEVETVDNEKDDDIMECSEDELDSESVMTYYRNDVLPGICEIIPDTTQV